MERRDFLSNLSSLFALGSLGTPLVGHATTGGLTLLDTSESGLDAYLDALKDQIRGIEASRIPSEIKRYFRQRGLPGRMAKDLLYCSPFRRIVFGRSGGVCAVAVQRRGGLARVSQRRSQGARNAIARRVGRGRMMPVVRASASV